MLSKKWSELVEVGRVLILEAIDGSTFKAGDVVLAIILSEVTVSSNHVTEVKSSGLNLVSVPFYLFLNKLFFK